MNIVDETDLREQIFNFISLSSDIVRNQYDADFSDAGGQIIYCFDSTVFNLFFDTVRWRHAVSSFYGNNWNSNKKSSQWQRIEAQSALIASEHLLSEDLPGAKNRTIYLTPWHRAELAANIDSLVKKYESGTLDQKKIEAEIKRKLRFLSLSRRVKTDVKFMPKSRDSFLKNDLESLRAHLSQRSSLWRYEMTRRAASLLVQCETSERLDQIHRIVTRPLRQRIKALNQLFHVAPDEQDEMATDARMWFLRIVREIEGDDGRNVNRRTPMGLWNDARSLAFVRWAAKKARRDQRLVLVTSDDRVFDAYRRWWADEGVTPSGETEQFILRRSFQYTPIFNLRDSRNDLSRTKGMHAEIQKLFFRIKEAVRMTLLPFNLAQIDGGNEIGGLAQNRQFEYMAMRAKDYKSGEPDAVIEFFMNRLNKEWYTEQSDAISDITELWREIERIGIGFFYDQVLKRLEDDNYLFGIEGETVDEDGVSVDALRYLTKSLETLTSKTRLAYLPITEAFLNEQFFDEDDNESRAPKTLWYTLPNGKSIYEMIRDWPRRGESNEKFHSEAIVSNAEAPFVLAAGFALRKHDWWKAEEFAGYALSAAKTRDPSSCDLAELLFLDALTKRFRLGSLAIRSHAQGADTPSTVSIETIKSAGELYSLAAASLDRSLRIIHSESVTPETILMNLRGKSELAALMLFLTMHEGFSDYLRSDEDPLNTKTLISRAQSEILTCIVEGKKASRTIDEDRFRIVRLQYLHNAAASEVVKYILHDPEQYSPNLEFLRVASIFHEKSYKQLEQINPLMTAERIVFQILLGAANPGEWPELETALADAVRRGLTVDRRLAKAISARKGDLFKRLNY